MRVWHVSGNTHPFKTSHKEAFRGFFFSQEGGLLSKYFILMTHHELFSELFTTNCSLVGPQISLLRAFLVNLVRFYFCFTSLIISFFFFFFDWLLMYDTF